MIRIRKLDPDKHHHNRVCDCHGRPATCQVITFAMNYDEPIHAVMDLCDQGAEAIAVKLAKLLQK